MSQKLPKRCRFYSFWTAKKCPKSIPKVPQNVFKSAVPKTALTIPYIKAKSWWVLNRFWAKNHKNVIIWTHILMTSWPQKTWFYSLNYTFWDTKSHVFGPRKSHISLQKRFCVKKYIKLKTFSENFYVLKIILQNILTFSQTKKYYEKNRTRTQILSPGTG